MLPTAGSVKRIFLTGAAGVLGGEVAKRLLSRGYSITALVNRSGEIRSNDGEILNCSRFGGGSLPPGRLAAISGDLGQDRLGWSPGAADWNRTIRMFAELRLARPTYRWQPTRSRHRHLRSP